MPSRHRFERAFTSGVVVLFGGGSCADSSQSRGIEAGAAADAMQSADAAADAIQSADTAADAMQPIDAQGDSANAPDVGGRCAVPAGAGAMDVSKPTTVVGDGSAASCTAERVAAAVAAGGVVTFSCGSEPLTIVVPEIQIVNDSGVSKDGSVTLDGGGKVTLSGGGKNRILRQNTCDPSLHFTTSHCNDQETPHLVLQNIGLTNAAGFAEQVDGKGLLGGGAAYVGGGTFKAVNLTVTNSLQTPRSALAA